MFGEGAFLAGAVTAVAFASVLWSTLRLMASIRSGRVMKPAGSMGASGGSDAKAELTAAAHMVVYSLQADDEDSRNAHATQSELARLQLALALRREQHD